MVPPLLKDSQLSGQDIKVWKDNLIHTLTTPILLSKFVNLHQKQLPIHKHNLSTLSSSVLPRELRKVSMSILPSLQRTCNLLLSRNYVSHFNFQSKKKITLRKQEFSLKVKTKLTERGVKSQLGHEQSNWTDG